MRGYLEGVKGCKRDLLEEICKNFVAIDSEAKSYDIERERRLSIKHK